MIVSFRRIAGALSVAAAILLGLLGSARAEDGDPPEVLAQRLVHILDYVTADYGGAVQGGVVTNPDEYEEQLSLIRDAAKIAAKLGPAGESAGAASRVAKVGSLAEEHASAEQLGVAAAEARASIVGAFKLVEAPEAAPNEAHGRALFNEHCATCHGESGHADTARAKTLTPKPPNFHDPKIGEGLTPQRVSSTVRFGVSGTAMVPFTFLSDADRWDLAFYVTGLRHTEAPAGAAPTYALAELAVRSDESLRGDLAVAGVAEDHIDAMLADLRKRAPYEDRAAKAPLAYARAKLYRAKVALGQGDHEAARGHLIDAYLEGVEPAEGALRAADPDVVASLEQHFLAARGALANGATPAVVDEKIDQLLTEITRADALMTREPPGFVSTAVSSAGILLREGVEAALLIAALLGIAVQAGLGERRRLVHAGWASALVLGLITWLVSREMVQISGASREMIEGVTALLATAVLFYVSYSLIAKREVARWMKFLRSQVTARRAGISLFGVAFLAAYREAFETVLFYQALLASDASAFAALIGALGGAVALVALVLAYSRAGRFAPPQVFFKISSYLLYGLAIVFIGQGVAAMQMVGVVPVHPIAMPSIPALGVHATIETCLAQLALIAAALVGAKLARRAPDAPPAEAPPADRLADAPR